MTGMKILVVDDEPKIVKILEHTLRREGFAVVAAGDGEEALRRLVSDRPDLVILDLMLPKVDGFEVCRTIRATSSVPILVLSARSEEIDRVTGFRLGIDDYVIKPFSPSELVLRVKAILRRTLDGRNAPDRELQIIRCAQLEIDRRRREARRRGEPVRLTAREFDLLWFLASHPGQVFTREQLLSRVWDTDYLGGADTVTVLVRRLREKIEEDPQNPRLLRTVWGIGYKFVIDD